MRKVGIRLEKNGKDVTCIFAKSGKGRPFNIQDFDVPEIIFGKNILGHDERGDGNFSALEFEGKVYEKTGESHPPAHKHEQQKNQSQKKEPYAGNKKSPPGNPHRSPARAPYNFIPLNKKIIPALPHPGFAGFPSSLYSGKIEIDITTKTDFFTRGKGAFIPKDSKGYYIEGSTIRGLLLSMTELVSFSQLRFFQNSRYYLRSMADVSSVKDYYKKGMYDNNQSRRSLPGFLVYSRETDSFVIYEAELGDKFPHDSKEKFSHQRTQRTEKYKVYTGGMRTKTGGMSQNWTIIKKKNGKKYKVPDEVVRDYQDDDKKYFKVGNNDYDLTGLAKRKPSDVYTDGVPLFFIKSNEETVKAFGHTANFRTPYHNTVSDFINQRFFKVLEGDTADYDFAQAIFGMETKFAGRVYPGKFYLKGNPMLYDREQVPKVLSTPRPTTFQHYLTQPDGSATPVRRLVHWGSDNATIRGMKQYWHRKTSHNHEEEHSWAEKPNNVNARRAIYADAIKALQPGNVFTGFLHFENLHAEELGALLTAIDIPEGCCHKLGMGKPLGLGSVKLSSRIIIDDKPGQYRQAVSITEDGLAWHTPQKKIEKEECKKAFIAHLIKYIETEGKDALTDLWNISSLSNPDIKERFESLRDILLFDAETGTPEWLEKTRYMMIEKPLLDQNGNPQKDYKGRPQKVNEYKERPVLPTIQEVKNGKVIYK